MKGNKKYPCYLVFLFLLSCLLQFPLSAQEEKWEVEDLVVNREVLNEDEELLPDLWNLWRNDLRKEIWSGGAVVRFLVMMALMPLRALAGYFAGQAALPTFRIVGSVCALRRDWAVPPAPYWNRAAVRRLARAFGAILAYQGAPMAAALVEQSVLRTALPDFDSAGYYMASRFSDVLYYLTFPLLLVMFPYTAAAGRRRESTRPFVRTCAAVTLAAAALMAGAYALFGTRLLALLPHGANYAAYARWMPWMVVIAALTTCQVFQTNAAVSAGRFGFLAWLVPLHVAYPLVLAFAASRGCVTDLPTLLAWFGGASLLRFAFACADHVRGR